MRSLALALVTPLFLSCTEEPPEVSSDGSSTESATVGSGSTTASTGTPMPTETSAESSGPPPSTTTATTTGETADSSSDSGPPLEGDVLQNDSWTTTDSLEWQTWPGMNDCWASVFEADPGQYPFDLVGARVAVGGGDGIHTYQVGVWEVSNQGQPTVELGGRTIDIDGAVNDFTEVDLSGLGLPAFEGNDEFALVMCHTDHMGAPSIAVDADGDVDGSRNWVRAAASGVDWVQSPDFFGIGGDFILRAVIMPQ